VSASTTALRAALADEHAAVYLLGVLSSRVPSGPVASALAVSYTAHRDVRDALLEQLAAAGDATVPGPAPAYALPSGLGTEAGVRAAALVVEQRCTITYGALVAATTGADRTRAIGWLTAAAVRQLRFGGSPSDLPGL
jgi:hypothetical protein